jgi:hypothetical protein
MELQKVLGINRLLDRFRRDVSDVFNYHFKTLNPSDFELIIIFTAKSKVLKSVFNQVKKVLVRKDTKFTKLHTSNSDVLQRFEIPEQFNGRILTAILKQVKEIEKEVKKDGIKILRYQVDKCFFENKDDTTTINIKLGGIYTQ